MRAGGLQSLGNCVTGYVKLTVEASAKYQKGYSVNMKIVAASRAPAECSQESGYDQENNPYAEYSTHGPVGGRELIGDQ
jgi:hypothetical protein